MKRALKALLVVAKSLLAAALLYWVFSRVSWPSFRAALQGLRFGYVAAAVAVQLLFMVLLSVRWWLLLRTAAIPMPFREANRLNFLGIFFSTFMPGSVGGDVVKGWAAARRSPNKAAAVVSIVLDRLLGLFAFALLAALACGAALAIGRDPGQLRPALISAGVLAAGVVGGLSVLLSARLRSLFRLRAIAQRLKLTRYTESAGEAARLYEHHLLRLAWPAALSLLATLVMVSSFALLGSAVRLPTPWTSYFLYVPLIMIISAVPLTPGGLGVVEQLYLFYFATAGCPPSQVLAFVLLVRLLGIVCSLPGSIALIAGERVPNVVASRAGGVE
jgi:uncharacterized protein (TIRG00374 family)